MHAGTLLRKLRLQEALSEDELKDYLEKVRSDGSLPPAEIPQLLELMVCRTEKLSIQDIKEISYLAGGNNSSPEKAGRIDEDHAMRAIVSKLTK